MGYVNMGEQFGDAKRAVNYLPKNMRSRLGQTADDLAQIGKKMTAVTTAAEAVARKMENPVPPAAPAVKAVSVKIPYTPIALGIAAVLAVVIFSQN
jgi:hypothetical protein